jgi:hypothetical protein
MTKENTPKVKNANYFLVKNPFACRKIHMNSYIKAKGVHKHKVAKIYSLYEIDEDNGLEIVKA